MSAERDSTERAGTRLDLPTLREAGVTGLKDYEVTGWTAVLAPRGTEWTASQPNGSVTYSNARSGAPLRIVVADSNVFTRRKLMAMLVDGTEHFVYPAENGNAALALAMEVLPHVIIAHCDLPLLDGLKGERVGLVLFAGTAFLQSPLSADYEILREFLPALSPEFLPEGGSNYGALIEASLQAFGASGSADRFLVILSDGEATDDEWKSRAEELKKKNIRVIGLGVGTPAPWAMVPDLDPALTHLRAAVDRQKPWTPIL